VTTDPEAAFEEPWQVRLFALTQAVVGDDREAFRQRLISAIDQDPHRGYWESWLAAFEDLVAARTDV